jgi:Tol biopolymer transport system component
VLYQATPADDPDSSADTSLRVVASDGSGDQLLFEGNADCPNPGRPAVAPDGTRLALVCFDEDGVRLKGIGIFTLDGEHQATLRRDATAGTPTWTKDGYIVYWEENDHPFGGGKGRSLQAVAVDESEPSKPLPLTADASTRDSVPAVSPNGDQLVFVRATKPGNEDLYLLELDQTDGLTAGVPIKIEASSPDFPDRDPAWTPGGSAILYTVQGRIMQVAPDDLTADAEVIFDPSPEDRAGEVAGARR